MTNYLDRTFDVLTQQETIREYSESEIAEVKQIESDILQRQTIIQRNLDEATAARFTVLAKLGITEDEAKLLLS